MVLLALRDRLNRSIFKLHFETALSDPWWKTQRVLDVKRVCDYIQTSVFIVSLWVGDPERAMYEHIDRLNFIKIKLDQYVDLMGGSQGKVSDRAVKIWAEALHAKNLDYDNMLQNMGYLWKILFLSNTLKFQYALDHCGEDSLRVEICRLYSDDLDTAVGLLSMQIESVRKIKLDLIA